MAPGPSVRVINPPLATQAPLGNATNDNESDDEDAIRPHPASIDLQYRLIEQAKRKFPEDWKRIIEFVLDETGEGVVELVEPLEYLRASDKQELRRLHEGSSDFSKIQRPLTAGALVQVAKGQLAFQIGQWERMKTEPGFLYDLVVEKAFSASEQLPLSSTRKSLKARDMLANPDYVGFQVRYLSHNKLLDIASWSAILAYLQDIEKLDNMHGRFGRRLERGKLMGQVKSLLARMEFKKYRDLMKHVHLLPEFRPYLILHKRHDDFAGGITEFDFISFPNVDEVVEEESLRGSFVRMMISGYDRTSDTEPFNSGLLDDLSHSFAIASAEEKQALSPELLAAWGDLGELTGITIMLGTDGEGRRAVALPDKRVIALSDNGLLSEEIFRASLVEKPIKSAESLKSEAVLQAIWDEVQKVSLKKSKKSIEKVLAFAPVRPTWSHKPATIARPQPVPTIEPPSPPAPPPQLETSAQPTELPEELESTTPVLELNCLTISVESYEPPVDAKPRPVSVYTVPNIPESTPPLATVKAPKVKRRGVPKPPTRPPFNITNTRAELNERTVYCVGKEAHDTFYKLFVESQSMKWVDFTKAMTSVEFAVIPTGGSSVRFDPPDWAKTSPFFVHRPHGPQMDIKLVRNIGFRLKGQYGWTIDWFSDERPGSELE